MFNACHKWSKHSGQRPACRHCASGVEPAELIRLFNSEPLKRNAVFQRMMYDAGKYRLVMKARDAAAAKPVPPVQRPGMARTPAEREHADLRTLSARLSSSMPVCFFR